MSQLHKSRWLIVSRALERGTALTDRGMCPGCLAQIGAPAPAVDLPADAPATLEAAGPSMMDSVETQVCALSIVLPFALLCFLPCQLQYPTLQWKHLLRLMVMRCACAIEGKIAHLASVHVYRC